MIDARDMRTTNRSFSVIQLDTASKATLCEQAKLGDDELVELSVG